MVLDLARYCLTAKAPDNDGHLEASGRQKRITESSMHLRKNVYRYRERSMAMNRGAIRDPHFRIWARPEFAEKSVQTLFDRRHRSRTTPRASLAFKRFNSNWCVIATLCEALRCTQGPCVFLERVGTSLYACASSTRERER